MCQIKPHIFRPQDVNTFNKNLYYLTAVNLQSNNPDPFDQMVERPFLGYTLQTSQIPYNNVNKITFP